MNMPSFSKMYALSCLAALSVGFSSIASLSASNAEVRKIQVKRGIFPPTPITAPQHPAFYPGGTGGESTLSNPEHDGTALEKKSREIPADKQQAFLGISLGFITGEEEACEDAPSCEEKKEPCSTLPSSLKEEPVCAPALATLEDCDAADCDAADCDAEDMQCICWEWFPCTSSFRPLIANLKEARFTLAMSWDDEAFGTDLLLAGMGDTIPLLRFYPDSGMSEWELGVMASVIGYWDLRRGSQDLIEHDYFVGIPLSYRRGDWSLRARYTLMASYLARDTLTLSSFIPTADIYQHTAELHAAWEPTQGLRYYVGGGHLWENNEGTRDIHPWFVEAGGEVALIDYGGDLLGLSMTPFLASHLRWAEQHSWHMEATCLAGFQWGEWCECTRSLRTYVEIYDGYSTVPRFNGVKSTHFAVRVSFGF